jgi:hypothetical protein
MKSLEILFPQKAMNKAKRVGDFILYQVGSVDSDINWLTTGSIDYHNSYEKTKQISINCLLLKRKAKLFDVW